MIAFDISVILNYFSSSFLFATFLWFATVGFLVHACVIMLLTRLSFVKIVPSLLQFHGISLMVSYVFTPIVTGLCSMLMQFFNEDMAFDVPNQIVYIYFALLMFLVSSIFLCTFFVQSTCKKFKQSLFVADSLMAVLGYFVLMLVQQNTGIVG